MIGSKLVCAGKSARKSLVALLVLALLVGSAFGLTLSSCSDSANVSQTSAEESAAGSGDSASKDSSDGSSKAAEKEGAISVTVTVSSASVDNVVSATVSPSLDAGVTVLDALRETGLAVESASSEYGEYVTGIGDLKSGDHGSMSGWIYTVNGSSPSESCDTYVLEDGDEVAWEYVTEF